MEARNTRRRIRAKAANSIATRLDLWSVAIHHHNDDCNSCRLARACKESIPRAFLVEHNHPKKRYSIRPSSCEPADLDSGVEQGALLDIETIAFVRCLMMGRPRFLTSSLLHSFSHFPSSVLILSTAAASLVVVPHTNHEDYIIATIGGSGHS